MVKVYTAYHPTLSNNNFYGSTQSRLRTYTADRRIEEQNGEIQQSKVYQKLAEERGDVESADRLARLGTMVINKFGQQVMTHTVPTNAPLGQQKFDIRSYLKQAIENGTLSQLWDRMKNVPDSKLSKVAQIIKSDLKVNKMLKEELNIKLKEVIDTKLSAQKIDEFIQLLEGNKENEPALEEIITQAISGLSSPSGITFEQKKKEVSLTEINANVAKQLALQNKKFGQEDEEKTEQGSIAPLTTPGRKLNTPAQNYKKLVNAIISLEDKSISSNPTRDITEVAYLVSKPLEEKYKKRLYSYVEKQTQRNLKRFGPSFIDAVEFLLSK